MRRASASRSSRMRTLSGVAMPSTLPCWGQQASSPGKSDGTSRAGAWGLLGPTVPRRGGLRPNDGRLVEQEPVEAELPHRLGELLEVHRLNDVAVDPKLV